MVYGRKRYGYRRKGRRANRTLSTRNIFNNKGSRAQASQISALRKRINHVYRQCKPELRVKQTMEQSYAQTAYGYNIDTPNAYSVNFADPKSPAHDMSIDLPVNGNLDDDMSGNVINLKDVTTYINLRYELLKDARLMSLPQEFSDQAMIRFVFFLSRTPNDDVVDPSELFDLSSPNALSADYRGFGQYPAGYSLNTVMPLKSGTASKFIILKDIRCKVGILRPDKQLRVRIPLRRYMKYIKDQYTIFGKGTIRCFAITSSLEVKGIRDADNNYIYSIPRLKVDWSTKVAYTDP